MSDLSPRLRKQLRAAVEAEHPAATIVVARKILEDHPTHAATLTRLGHALTELANYEEAEAVLRKALLYCDESRRDIVCGKLGYVFKFRGDFETAAQWFRQAIEWNPDDATGYIFLGGALARQGKLREAEAVHRKAVRCSEGCIDEAYHNLGLVLRGQGRLRESRVCLEKSLELDPECEETQAALDDVNRAIEYAARVK